MDIIKEYTKRLNETRTSVNCYLKALTIVAPENTYDCRACTRFNNQWMNIKFNIYNIESFINYMKSCSKYFTCKQCYDLVQEIVNTLNQLIRTYGEFLY